MMDQAKTIHLEQSAQTAQMIFNVLQTNYQSELSSAITYGLPTLPANLCPFSGRRELARFSEDFGEAVGEPVKAKARSTVW
jgi:hypothetical protein